MKCLLLSAQKCCHPVMSSRDIQPRSDTRSAKILIAANFYFWLWVGSFISISRSLFFLLSVLVCSRSVVLFKFWSYILTIHLVSLTINREHNKIFDTKLFLGFFDFVWKSPYFLRNWTVHNILKQQFKISHTTNHTAIAVKNKRWSRKYRSENNEIDLHIFRTA